MSGTVSNTNTNTNKRHLTNDGDNSTDECCDSLDPPPKKRSKMSTAEKLSKIHSLNQMHPTKVQTETDLKSTQNKKQTKRRLKKQKRKMDAIKKGRIDSNCNDMNKDSISNDDNHQHGKDSVSAEDVFSCIKTLEKIKNKPQILHFDLFRPVASLLQSLDVNSNQIDKILESKHEQLKLKNKEIKHSKRKNRIKDLKKLHQCGIRRLRNQTATQSQQFHKMLTNNDNDIKDDDKNKYKSNMLTLNSDKDENNNSGNISDNYNSNSSGDSYNSNCNSKNECLNQSKRCYVCKHRYHNIHSFYDSLCVKCGDFNMNQRSKYKSMDLTNKICIVTGGRIKIGYEMVLMLLRCNATVIATTRFPNYAIKKYSNEKDFDKFQNRLIIYGLDLCSLNQIDQFINYISKKFKKIDILINNAATTIRRSKEFYTHLIEMEHKQLPKNLENQIVPFNNCNENDNQSGSNSATNHLPSVRSIMSDSDSNINKPLMLNCSSNSNCKNSIQNDDEDNKEEIMNHVIDTIGIHDEHGQLISLDNSNSWTTKIGQINPLETMETIMVNQFSPLMLINKLTPLLSRKNTIIEHIDDNKNMSTCNNSNDCNSNNNLSKRSNRFEKKMRKMDKNLNDSCDDDKDDFYEANKDEMNFSKYNPHPDIDDRSYVINVSSMEGCFNHFKQGTHVHTNMAKAALNMSTRTLGRSMAFEHNCFIVSVDTGWVTDELPLKERIKSKMYQYKHQDIDTTCTLSNSNSNSNSNDQNDDTNDTTLEAKDFVFHPPLDEIDGAARVLHPIFQGMQGNPMFGIFLKDYRKIDW